MVVKRLKNKTYGPLDLNVGNNQLIRLPGRDKKHPEHNISRPVTDEEIQSLDVQVNLKAGDIEVIVEEV